MILFLISCTRYTTTTTTVPSFYCLSVSILLLCMNVHNKLNCHMFCLSVRIHILFIFFVNFFSYSSPPSPLSLQSTLKSASRLAPPTNELVVTDYTRSVLIQIFDNFLKLFTAQWFTQIDGNTLKLSNINGTTTILIMIVKRLAQFVFLLSCELSRLE